MDLYGFIMFKQSQMGVSTFMDIYGWFLVENPMRVDDLGVPLFQEPLNIVFKKSSTNQQRLGAYPCYPMVP